MSWKIYCPSLKRHNLAISHKLFPKEKFVYCIHEEEYELYKKSFPDYSFLVNPRGNIKNVAYDRNFILENSKENHIIMVDDDLTGFERNYDRKRIKMDSGSILDMIEKGFQMCLDSGSGIWGINCQTDPRFYGINRPFSFSHIILGPFIGFMDKSLRYDINLPLKEDYDMYLQMLMKHRVTFRMNMFSYICDHQKMAGGCQTYRTSDAEREQFSLLQKKWGSDLVQENYKAKGSINPIIKRPL